MYASGRSFPHVPAWVWEVKEKILAAGLDEAEARAGARHVTCLRFLESDVLIDYASPQVPLSPEWGEMVYDLGNQLEMLWWHDERPGYSPQPLVAVNSGPDRADIAVLTDRVYCFYVGIRGATPAGGTWESIRDHIARHPDTLVQHWH